MARNSREVERQVPTIIGRGTDIVGNLNIQTSTRIDGKIKGEIVVKEQIVLGPESFIDGTITAKSAYIGGKVTGSIKCSNDLTLAQTAKFEGEMASAKLVIEEGAVFNGKSSMLSK